MRPVNLIPPEDRRGENRPMRSGPLVHLVVGALVLILAGMTALVLTGNQISERKAEAAQLGREESGEKARAERLAAYTQFAALRAQRVSTVTSLADSRFDWERVMRELSRVIPSYAWLTSLSATATPEVSVEGGGSGGSASGSSLRGSIAGPAIEMSGCAVTHDGVAGLVDALKDVDGVTRVGVQSSALADPGDGAGAPSGGGSSGGGGESDCRTLGFITQFQLVIAFDAAPIPTTGEAGEEAAPVPAPEEPAATPTSSTEGG